VTTSSDASPFRDTAWTLPRRLRTPALVLLALFCVVVVGYAILRGATYSNDFKNPYRVARVFWRTGQLDIASEPRYPPTVRVLLAPLAALPIATAAAVWALASVAALAALPRLFARLGGVPVRAQALGWLAVLTFATDGLVLGQSDPINLFLVAAGLVLARENRSVTGAGLIGLAGMIKVLPVAFWGVLLVCRRARGAAAGAAITGLVGIALLTAFAGWSAGLHSIAEWYTIIGKREGPWGLIAEGNSLRENNESLPVVLARTFGAVDAGLTRNAVSLARVPLGAIWGVWMAIVAAMGIAWLACAWRARRAPPARAWLGMFALTAVMMLAATPIAWPHYFLWLLPAALFLADRPRLLVAVAGLGQLGMMVPVLRGLGCHMWLALALFALVASDLIAARGGWRGVDAGETRQGMAGG
jgi:hypothetical protein